jgi:polyferredoxin
MSILLCITLAVGLSLAFRTPLKVDVIRDRGMPRVLDDDLVENVYRLQVMNTDEHAHRYIIEVSGMPGIALSSDSEFDMPPAATRAVPVRVRVKTEDDKAGSMPIRFVVRNKEDASVAVYEKAVFLVPRH